MWVAFHTDTKKPTMLWVFRKKSFDCLLCEAELLYEGVETGLVIYGKFGNLLSVKLHILLFEGGHKYAVLQAANAAGGVDSGYPEAAEFAPADSAVAIGVNAGVHLGVFCEFIEAGLVAEIASC